jgi:hypothetical protein
MYADETHDFLISLSRDTIFTRYQSLKLVSYRSFIVSRDLGLLPRKEDSYVALTHKERKQSTIKHYKRSAKDYSYPLT